MNLRTKQPVILNALQLRLAMELACQEAARLEIKHQLGPYFPHQNVTVDGAEIDITSFEWDGPFILPDGREVVWK